MGCIVLKNAIVCMRGGKQLTEEEKEILEKYIDFVDKRADKRKAKNGSRVRKNSSAAKTHRPAR